MLIGIAGRMGSLTEDDNSYSEERLKKLSSFQSVILKKALSFPAVKKVVYSTCSIHSEENEQVLFLDFCCNSYLYCLQYKF